VIAAKEKAAADERAAEAARMERNRAAEEKRQAELDASRKAANEYIEALRREIISISKYSPKEWAESSAVALIFPPVWEGWATLYEKGSKLSLSAEQEAVRQTFKKSLSNKQVEIFPAQRNLYGPAMRKKLWEADGKASTFGPGYRTVEFVSAAFAANRNIKEIHQRMAPALMMFRFTRAQYKWVDANVEYSYYTLAPPKDSDGVIWSDDGSFRVL
jgi:hypothetical protein